jgi:glutamine cyclotransferase
MMTEDIESGGMRPVEIEWVRPAVRRQNRWFALGVSLTVIGAAVFVLATTYSTPSELPVDAFDAEGGTVGNDVKNEKEEEKLDKEELKSSTHQFFHHGNNPYDKNPFNVPYQNRDYYGQDIDEFTGFRHNRTHGKEAYMLDRWNRTHPGMPYPGSQFNDNWNHFTPNMNPNNPYDMHNMNQPDHTFPGKGRPTFPGKGRPSTPIHHFHRNKTSADEDAGHDLDLHVDEPPKTETIPDAGEEFPISNVVTATNPPSKPEPDVQPNNPDSNGHDDGKPSESSSNSPDVGPETNSPKEPESDKPIQTSTKAPSEPVTTTEKPKQDVKPVETSTVTSKPDTAETTSPAEEAAPTTNTKPVPVQPNDEKATDDKVDQTGTDEPPGEASSSGVDIEAWQAAKVDASSGIKYEIVDQLFHDSSAFTQGLTYANGKLYESNGLYGESSIQILDPDTGHVKESISMDPMYFGEGMTFYDDKLVQIVWKKAKGFVYDADNLSAPPIKEFDYTTTKNNEGWGITYDPDRHELIVTDGSANLIFWDADCWKTGQCDPKPDKPTVQVKRLNGAPARQLNEIEYWRGRVLSNVWYTDLLLVIHPESGLVEKEYDFKDIFPISKRPPHTDVFNGISISEDPDVIYVTGKLWDRMFKVKLLT